MKTAIVIQGSTICDNIEKLKNDWKPFPIIFSTWEGEPTYCYADKNDVVVYSPRPEIVGVGNLNLQRVSSLNGFIKAKELGYDRVVKWRYDLFPINCEEIFKSFKSDCLNFLAYHQHNAGYLVDYLSEGNVDDMIQLFTFSDFNVPHAEVAFTNRLFELGFDKKINFILKNLEKDRVDIYWQKYNNYLSHYKNIEAFKT
jgi:hypothetical protein